MVYSWLLDGASTDWGCMSLFDTWERRFCGVSQRVWLLFVGGGDTVCQKKMNCFAQVMITTYFNNTLCNEFRTSYCSILTCSILGDKYSAHHIFTLISETSFGSNPSPSVAIPPQHLQCRLTVTDESVLCHVQYLFVVHCLALS